jgi:hypothetical protein
MLNFLDSNVMIAKSWELLLFLTMGPESPKELLVGLLLAYIAISITLAKTHALAGTSSSSIIIGLIVTPIGLFGMVEAAVLSQMLLYPLMVPEYHAFAYYTSIVVAVFLLLIPFTRAFFRAAYVSSLLSWIVAFFVGAGVLMAVDFYFRDNSDEERTSTSLRSVQKYTEELKKKVMNEAGKYSGKIKNEAPKKQVEHAPPAP